MKMRMFLFCMIIALFASPMMVAETASTVPVPYGPAEFPEWQKDLRRAEILSFGALPFVTFMASIYYDVYRYVDNDQNEAYLPWPLKKSAIAVPLTEDEQKNVLLVSAGISIGVAVFDFGFRALMREIRNSKTEKKNREIVDPIQIKAVENNE